MPPLFGPAIEGQEPLDADPWYENVYEKLNPFELLSLPGHVIGETVGQFRESGDPFAAVGQGLEGLYRGTDEAYYPSVGKQLLPETDEPEGEDPFGRKVARFGIDVATDPLTWFGGPLLKGGARLAGKGLTKVGAHPAAQRISRWILPPASVLSTWGGRGGRLARLKNERAEEVAATGIGKWASTFDEVLKRVGADNDSSAAKAMREAASNAIEDGNVRRGVAGRYELATSTGDRAVDDLAVASANYFDELGMIGENYRDIEGKGFMVTNFVKQAPKTPGGKPWYKKVTEPFKRYENYVPWRLKDEVTEGMVLGTKSGKEAAAQKIARMGNIPISLARRIIKSMVKPTRAGHVELPRVAEIPRELLERDLAKLVPAYLNQVMHRMAFGDEFALSGRKLYQLMDDATNPAKGGLLEPDTATEVLEILIGKPKFSKTGLDRISRNLAAFQVLNKMGPMSTLSNLSQSLNTFISEGASSLAGGLSKTFAKGDNATAAIVYNRSLRDTMEQLLGAKPGGWASKWLDLVKFNPVERFNRILAANAGISTMERLLRSPRTKKAALDMTRRGYTKALDEAYQALGRLPTNADDYQKLVGEFTRKYAKLGYEPAEAIATERAAKAVDDLYKVALRASNKTQHATRYIDIPAAWQSPEGRLMTQFKTFLHQQSRFILKEIVRPMRKGDYGPFVRAAAAFGLGGPAVAWSRDFYRRKTAALLTGEEPEPKHEFDWEHPIMSSLGDMVYVGGLGIVGDLTESLLQNRGLSFVAGPTLSDLADAGSRLTKTGYTMAYEGEAPAFEDVVGAGYRYMPGRRLFGALPSEVSQQIPEVAAGEYPGYIPPELLELLRQEE